MAPTLEIRLLGPFELVADGRSDSAFGSKRAALIAVLGLRRGRVVAVDDLIEALWGTKLPAASRNALQHHVTRLRAALGHESIVAAADGYVLTDASVDALEFEELLAEARAALPQGDAPAAADAVARGLTLWCPPLHDLPDTPWVTAEARRLEALRVDTREEDFEVALALGTHAGVDRIATAAATPLPCACRSLRSLRWRSASPPPATARARRP
jgi:DNA-binding SARP family transcriptional activator